MFKDVLQHMDLSVLTSAGLIIFFIVFLFVVLYALSRSRSQAQQWAEIPLTSEPRRHPREESKHE